MSLALQTFSTVTEASAALKAAGARYLGGGTFLVRDANEGDVSFSTFVRSTDPSLSAIAMSGSEVRIGASATMAAVARHHDLGFLAKVANAIGAPAIRNMATVGGNLFAESPYGDFTVALLALDARVSVAEAGTPGVELPLGVFLAERDSFHAGKIVTAVTFEIPEKDEFRFLKVSRVKPRGVAVVSIAAVLREDLNGISSARIAFGCMADRPVRGKAVETALAGRKRTKEGIEPALAVALEGMSPITDAIASGWYRGEVLPVHLGRLLLA
jgi:CO/xanthine dehydrogenase FAD-binding subunit